MVTAVVLTKNEEKNMVDCLESLSFCDEILVVDDNSEDRTEEVARRLGARVLKHALAGDFSRQRNFGLQNAKNEWILFLDADERVGKDIIAEIVTATASGNYDGYFIKRKDIMWGRSLKYGEAGNIKLLRLGKKTSGRWMGKVHEEWIIRGKVGKLSGSIEHYPHPIIAEFLSEINHYSTLRAQELYLNETDVKWYTVLFYPKAKFFQNFILRLGFLDGLPGFIYAAMMSFHSFLVRGKLWLLNQKKS